MKTTVYIADSRAVYQSQTFEPRDDEFLCYASILRFAFRMMTGAKVDEVDGSEEIMADFVVSYPQEENEFACVAPCWICGRYGDEHVDSDFNDDGCCTRYDLKKKKESAPRHESMMDIFSDQVLVRMPTGQYFELVEGDDDQQTRLELLQQSLERAFQQKRREFITLAEDIIKQEGFDSDDFQIGSVDQLPVY